MFGVWIKDKFLDWWHNEKSDTGWIERMIESLGVNKEDVDVIWYTHWPAAGVAFSFDSEKRIVIHEKVSGERIKINNEGVEEFEPFEYFRPSSPKLCEPWMTKGVRVKK